MENYHLGTEIDELLAKAVARHEALKMPKAKKHWKQAAQERRRRNRVHEATPSRRAYCERRERSPRRKYNKLKRQIERRGISFELSYEEWAWMWAMCPMVNGAPALTQRGKGKGRVHVERIDTIKGYSKDNVQIVHGKKVLWP